MSGQWPQSISYETPFVGCICFKLRFLAVSNCFNNYSKRPQKDSNGVGKSKITWAQVNCGIENEHRACSQKDPDTLIKAIIKANPDTLQSLKQSPWIVQNVQNLMTLFLTSVNRESIPPSLDILENKNDPNLPAHKKTHALTIFCLKLRFWNPSELTLRTVKMAYVHEPVRS